MTLPTGGPLRNLRPGITTRCACTTDWFPAALWAATNLSWFAPNILITKMPKSGGLFENSICEWQIVLFHSHIFVTILTFLNGTQMNADFLNLSAFICENLRPINLSVWGAASLDSYGKSTKGGYNRPDRRRFNGSDASRTGYGRALRWWTRW